MRIDARRGQVAGVSSGRRTTLATAGGEFAEAGRAVAVALKRRQIENDQREAARQEAADRVTLAKEEAALRERLTVEFDADADAYDGSSPGFADRWRERLDTEIETAAGRVDPRIGDAARLKFQNVRDSFALAAINVEDAKRDVYALRGVNDVIDGEVSTVMRDAASLPLARRNVDDVIETAPGDREKHRREAYGRLGDAALAAYESKNPWRGEEALERGDFDELLSPEKRQDWRRKLADEQDRRLRDRERKEEKARRDAKALVDEEVKDIDRLRRLGLPVSDERYQQLSRVASIAGEDVAETVRLARSANRAGDEIRKMPLATAVSAVSTFRQELSKGGDVDRGAAMTLEAAEASLAGMRKAADGDFLSFAASARGGVEPLDFTDPVASLKKRAAAAKEQADYYGVARVRYFTDDELAALKSTLDGDPQKRALFIDAVASAGAPQMMSEIAPAAPTIAHVAGLRALGGDRQFQDDVLRGQDLRAKKQLGSTIDRRNAVVDRIESETYGGAFLRRPEAKARALESAGLAYDARSNDNSRTKDEFDAAEYKLMLQRAAGATGEGDQMRGGVATYRGRQVWVPPYLRQKDFPRVWGADANWKAANGAPAYDDYGKEIPVAQLKRGHPIAVDSGVYIINFAKEGEPIKWAADENGQPWRFDMNKVRASFATEGENNDQ